MMNHACMHGSEHCMGVRHPAWTLQIAVFLCSRQRASALASDGRVALHFPPSYKGHLLLAMHDKLTRLMTKQLQLTGTTKHTSNRLLEI